MSSPRTSLLIVGAGAIGFATGLMVGRRTLPSWSRLPPAAVSDSADSHTRTLVALQHRLAAAFAPLDSIALDSLLADDLHAINAADQVIDKATAIRVLRAAAASLVKVVDDSIRVRRYGPVALMTLRETVSSRTDSGEAIGHLRMTEVWLRRGGHWRAVQSQASVIP
jgi:Domain of unknown function (DUF4440)